MVEGGHDAHARASLIKGVRPDIDAVSRSLRRDPPAQLHHYTTGDTLLSILAGKQMWATHASCLNDSAELRHAWGVFLEACERECPVDPKYAPLLAEFRRRLPGEPASTADLYVACFSTEPDDLAQWRAYGAHASGEGGYMLTLDGPSLLDRLTAVNTYPRLVEVLYDPRRQYEAMKPLAALAFDRFPSWSEVLGRGRPMDAWVRDYASMWFAMLAELAPCMKHKAFEGEREWRVIAAYPGQAPDRPELKFKQRSAMISRHLPLGDGSKPLPVRRIMVGPSRHKEVSRASLGLALQEWGYTAEALGWEVDVDASTTPVQTP